jgi:2-oxoglutarate dehydrogenase E1 component
LEIICPVVEGSIRARQERLGDKKRNKVLPVLIHGDAAFAGQGVVMETLNLSQTRGYSTGGTIHIVINNQIGFTTSDPLDSRSTLYCTDVAKMVQAPIFHVNGDDPEAVLFLTRLALDFRMTFNKDVVIDMVCYRRHGHNETDEPAATQPVMYQKIAEHPKVQSVYAQKLTREGVIGPEESEVLLQQYRAALRTKEVVSPYPAYGYENAVNWRPYMGTRWDSEANTQISLKSLQQLIEKMTTVPTGFKLNRTVERLVQSWRKMGNGELPFDWGCGETLAYASLLTSGYPIRLSGQDSGRGTFAHRHAVWHHSETGETYLPLQHLSPKQAHFLVINSLLSEEAVLAFEVGYSGSEPETLVIWEAQFGDFANNAQVVIDQFISSSEAKWQRLCSVVMLLPHGYDGQGPEHSSARLERFLQLCAEDNIQVCIPSTPAQFFHLLRRQMLRSYRKPLIVMTPKSLLRHRLVVSHLTDFTSVGFQVVMDESAERIVPEKVERLLFCSGRVYYDLIEAREERKSNSTAIIRLEQLYPLPQKAIEQVLKRYPQVQYYGWVQEEPQNQGAWGYIRDHLEALIQQEYSSALIKLNYAGRPPSASPAVGDFNMHCSQLRVLLNEALGNQY